MTNRRRRSQQERWEVWDKYIGTDKTEGPCAVCEDSIRFRDMIVGHDRALDKGGQDTIANVRPLCKRCDDGMGTMSIDEYRAILHGPATESGDPETIVNPEAVADYSEALKARQRAIIEVENMVMSIKEGADKLGRWQDVTIANIPGASFPVGRRLSIAGDRWPTGQQIADTLRAYHIANQEARSAWGRVPPKLRGVLQQTPDIYELRRNAGHYE